MYCTDPVTANGCIGQLPTCPSTEDKGTPSSLNVVFYFLDYRMVGKVQKVVILVRFKLDFRFSQRWLKSNDVSEEHSSACCLLYSPTVNFNGLHGVISQTIELFIVLFSFLFTPKIRRLQVSRPS
jgi:hypothetical protein